MWEFLLSLVEMGRSRRLVVLPLGLQACSLHVLGDLGILGCRIVGFSAFR